ALTQRNLVTQAESNNYLIEALTGIATLKATGAEARVLDYWSGLFFKQLQVSLQSSHLSALIEIVLNAVRTFTPLLLLWVGVTRVLDGTMSLGTMLALNTLATLCLMPLASLVANGQKLQLVGAHLERLSDVLDAKPEQDLRQVQTAPNLTGQIQLQHVHFRYDAHSSWVLQDVSLTVQPGQKIALVGRTGSGKSTLAKLLLGLYVPNSGEILYEGIPLQQLNYQTLRRQFGAVLQESALFSGSIRQNIALNDPNLPLEPITQAAKMAVIHDEIMQMPMGYETLISAGGMGLSGGQRQRLLMARALVHRPPVLLLDEATSQLDTITERLADENFNNLSCTRIVIAHRLSTVQNADLILVLDQGRIVEQGTHAQLLVKNGYYTTLLNN
ncbi:MAG TPA: peptidase domain-containing ABC transporter, partial [Candidatus Caenarcaniphilales bacterium]